MNRRPGEFSADPHAAGNTSRFTRILVSGDNTVEHLRDATGRAVSGFLFAKTHVQIGALKAAVFEAIEVVVADEGQPLPAFDIVVLRYDAARETILRNFCVSVVETVTVTDSCDAFVTLADGTIEK